MIHVELESDDRILLCTDGLSDMVSDASISQALSENSIQSACDILLDQALDAGGKDNITLVIGRVTAV